MIKVRIPTPLQTVDQKSRRSGSRPATNIADMIENLNTSLSRH